MVAHYLCLLLTAGLTAAPQSPDPTGLQRQFGALPAPRQLEVLAAIETRLQGSQDEGMQRIRRLAQEARDPPKLRPRTPTSSRAQRSVVSC